MPDDLSHRYQTAHRAWQLHTESCHDCTLATLGCPAGKRLFESFARLQDAYLTRLNQRRKR
ncbi:hypothetical protein [Streptomyces collinus]|uniref:hypothetical protein n=1 Tax=Streptomyces collinus TaxID=42684 RepID=UPI0036AF299E